jgi:hypothetical protein
MLVRVVSVVEVPDVSHRSLQEYVGSMSDGDQKAGQWRSENHLVASDPTLMPSVLRCNKSSVVASSSTSFSL